MSGTRQQMTGGIQKYSVTIAGHRTSISLEPVFWEALSAIAAGRGVPLATLITEIDRDRTANRTSDQIYNLSSAIRVFVLAFYRSAGTGDKQP